MSAALWAHGVWTAVAATLAQPLRDAYGRHVEEHGCGCDVAARFGRLACPDLRHLNSGGHLCIGSCNEAARLWDLLPAGDRAAPTTDPVPWA